VRACVRAPSVEASPAARLSCCFSCLLVSIRSMLPDTVVPAEIRRETSCTCDAEAFNATTRDMSAVSQVPEVLATALPVTSSAVAGVAATPDSLTQSDHQVIPGSTLPLTSSTTAGRFQNIEDGTEPTASASSALRVTLIGRDSLRPEGKGPGQGGPPVRTEVANRVKVLLFKQLQNGIHPGGGHKSAASHTERLVVNEPEAPHGCFCRRSSSAHRTPKPAVSAPASASQVDDESAPIAACVLFGTDPQQPWNRSAVHRIRLCVRHLRECRGCETPGILGASGSAGEVERLRLQTAHSGSLPTQADPHSIAGLLKDTLRRTRPALLSSDGYQCFLEMARKSGPGTSWDEAINIFRLWQRISASQPHSYCRDVLVEILLLLNEVSRLNDINKMTSRNLAVVMAPCLCDWDPLRPNALEQLHVMTDMVQYLIERAKFVADMEGHPGTGHERINLAPVSCAYHSSAESLNAATVKPPCYA
jgi:hypothetical protein